MYGRVRKSTELVRNSGPGVAKKYGSVRKCTEPILRQFLEKCPHFQEVVRECMFCSKNAILLIWGAFGDFCSKNAILLISGAFGDLAARSCNFATCDGFVVVL